MYYFNNLQICIESTLTNAGCLEQYNNFGLRNSWCKITVRKPKKVKPKMLHSYVHEGFRPMLEWVLKIFISCRIWVYYIQLHTHTHNTLTLWVSQCRRIIHTHYSHSLSLAMPSYHTHTTHCLSLSLSLSLVPMVFVSKMANIFSMHMCQMKTSYSLPSKNDILSTNKVCTYSMVFLLRIWCMWV